MDFRKSGLRQGMADRLAVADAPPLDAKLSSRGCALGQRELGAGIFCRHPAKVVTQALAQAFIIEP